MTLYGFGSYADISMGRIPPLHYRVHLCCDWNACESVEMRGIYQDLRVFFNGLQLMPCFQVFGTVARATVDDSEVRGIHEYNSFATFPNALFLMIRVITGENWQDVMLNCLRGQRCENSTGIIQSTGNMCGSDFAYFFFPSFYLISTIMVSYTCLCNILCIYIPPPFPVQGNK